MDFMETPIPIDIQATIELENDMKELNFSMKSNKDNIFIIAIKKISQFLLFTAVKKDSFENIKFENKYSYEEIKKNNKYLNRYGLVELFEKIISEVNKNSLKIIEDINLLKIIVQIEKAELFFKLPKKIKSDKELIQDLNKEIYEIKKELFKKNNLTNEIEIIKKENMELKQKLDNEIKEKEKLYLKINIIESQLKYILEKINPNKIENNKESKISIISDINRMNDDYKKYYEILEMIGRGGYGDIFKIKDKYTSELKALKRIYIDIDEFDEEDNEKKLYINSIKKSIEIMKICCKNNNNSVKFYEYFQNEKEIAIVMELCDGNLRNILNKNKEGFTVEQICKIMGQLNNTFKILKENNIIHGDLKLENILIKYEDINKYNFIAKLTDYGLSQTLIDARRTPPLGSYDYMAPELIEGKEYSYKCDLWSIGVIIYILFFKEHPYGGRTAIQILNNIRRGILKKSGNINLDDLIKKLLIKEPKKRIGWTEYFNHPFFKE